MGLFTRRHNPADEGVKCYNAGDFQSAIRYFLQATENVEVRYFLALSYWELSRRVAEQGKGQCLTEHLRWLTDAARNNHAKAQYRLADWYLSNRNKVEALLWFDAAARNGIAEAYDQMGLICAELGDIPTAMRWFRKGADCGDGSAQYNLGLSYANAGQPDAANFWYKRSAESGFYRGQHNYACHLLDLFNYSEAIKWFERAAAQGTPVSCYELGRIYLRSSEYAKAVRWLVKALGLGYAPAANLLAVAYYATSRKREAESLLMQADPQANPAARFYLVAFYICEKSVANVERCLSALPGTEQLEYEIASALNYFGNTEEIQPWLQQAAEKGSLWAMERLGLHYNNHKHYAEAAQWYRRAAEQGSLIAMHNLGVMYLRGSLKEPDVDSLAEAVKWLLPPAKQGLVISLSALRTAKTQLDERTWKGFFKSVARRSAQSALKEAVGTLLDDTIDTWIEGSLDGLFAEIADSAISSDITNR